VPPRIASALILALGLVGCDGVHSAYLTPGDRAAHEVRMPKELEAKRAPAAEAAALRAINVAQKLLDANPGLGARPNLLTLGDPKKTIFHSGNPQAGAQMFISQGMIDACKDDGQLAAVLATELGKIAAERAAQEAMLGVDRNPIEERIGDDHGAFGNGDGTRLMEAARREALLKQQKPVKPDPAALAKTYLTKAGYEADALKQVAGLLVDASKDDSLAEHFTADKPVSMAKPVPKAELQPPAASKQPPPAVGAPAPATPSTLPAPTTPAAGEAKK
jgi:hypothetical protein